ncbi:MAG: hypothetical protein RR370_01715 [Synergistaceae bacterium]
MVTDAERKATKKYKSKLKHIPIDVTPSFFDDLDQYLLDHGVKSRSEWIRQAIAKAMSDNDV